MEVIQEFCYLLEQQSVLILLNDSKSTPGIFVYYSYQHPA